MSASLRLVCGLDTALKKYNLVFNLKADPNTERFV